MHTQILLGNEKVTFYTDPLLNPCEEALSHFHIYYEIHFIISGSCTIGNESFHQIVRKNDIVIVPPHVIHYVKSFENSFSRYILSITFSQSDLKEKDPEYEKLFTQLNSLSSITIVNGNCDYIISEIRKYHTGNSPYRDSLLKNLFTLLLLKVGDSLNSHSAPDISSAVGYFPELTIDLYFSKAPCPPNANLTELANLLNMSNKQTERLLQQLSGTTFKKLLLKQRMSVAMELIQTTTMPFSQIAAYSGYNSYDVFYKAFTKYYHKSPTAFKSEVSCRTAASD